MQTLIEVNLQHEALHSWPEAKDKLPDVAFLSNEHRHMFHITLQKKVEHNDRDVEIIMFKHEVANYLNTEHMGHFGRMSCEDIATELMTRFDCEMVKVLEDGENGALVTK